MQDYWKKFDLLCTELATEGKQNLVAELRNAQSYVNGQTDGWYDFLDSFETTIVKHELKGQTKKLAIKLIEILKHRLENR